MVPWCVLVVCGFGLGAAWGVVEAGMGRGRWVVVGNMPLATWLLARRGGWIAPRHGCVRISKPIYLRRVNDGAIDGRVSHDGEGVAHCHRTGVNTNIAYIECA